MFCTNCGKNLPDGSVFCSGCGKQLNGNSMPNGSFNNSMNANQQSNAQGGYNSVNGNYSQNYQSATQDKSSTGMNILCFFIPLVGLILYLVWKQDYPNKSHDSGKYALIGFVVSMILSIISCAITSSSMMNY